MDSKPSWLNEELISNILDGATDIKMSISKAVPDGEHYFSTIHRVGVTFKNNSNDNNYSNVILIIKTFPNGVMSEFMKESGAMMREITMYNNVIPSLNESLSKEFAPKYYKCNKEDILILDDLIFKGFKMKDRIERLDFNHCKLALETLAEFHAVSIDLHNKNPELIESIGKEVLYVKDNDYMKSFIINCFNVLGNEIKNWPECSKYSNKLAECGEKMWDLVINALIPVKEELCVLNHGDFWTNNMLFYHNHQGIVEKVKFVDFQFCRWGNPAFDLQRFFNTSVRNREDIPKLINCYLNTFNKYYKTPDNNITNKQLDDYMNRMDCYGLIATACLLPTCVRSRDQPLDYQNVTRENYDECFEINNPYVKACKDPSYRKILPEMLEYYHQKGFI